MKNCPICYHPLPDTSTGQRQVCSFCGWVNATKNKKSKPLIQHYTALSPEEIARQQLQNNGYPVLSVVLTGIGFLLFTFFSIHAMLQSQLPPPPPPVAKTFPPEPTPSPTEPTPEPTFMPIPTPSPTLSNSPSLAMPPENLTPSAESPPLSVTESTLPI